MSCSDGSSSTTRSLAEPLMSMVSPRQRPPRRARPAAQLIAPAPDRAQESHVRGTGTPAFGSFDRGEFATDLAGGQRLVQQPLKALERRLARWAGGQPGPQ